MRLDELINEKYNILNDNDLLIWQYIQGHKKECSSVSIEKLAANAVFHEQRFPDLHRNWALKALKNLKSA